VTYLENGLALRKTRDLPRTQS